MQKKKEVDWTEKVISDSKEMNIGGILVNLVHFALTGNWKYIGDDTLYWLYVCPSEMGGICDGSCLECSWGGVSILINTKMKYVRVRGFHFSWKLLPDEYWPLFVELLPGIKKKVEDAAKGREEA